MEEGHGLVKQLCQPARPATSEAALDSPDGCDSGNAVRLTGMHKSPEPLDAHIHVVDFLECSL